MSVVCMRHPQYDGSKTPILSCKACCNLFIAAIKLRNAEGTSTAETYKWLEDKAREAKDSTRTWTPR